VQLVWLMLGPAGQLIPQQGACFAAVLGCHCVWFVLQFSVESPAFGMGAAAAADPSRVRCLPARPPAHLSPCSPAFLPAQTGTSA
jgi:hypothetical protein